MKVHSYTKPAVNPSTGARFTLSTWRQHRRHYGGYISAEGLFLYFGYFSIGVWRRL